MVQKSPELNSHWAPSSRWSSAEPRPLPAGGRGCRDACSPHEGQYWGEKYWVGFDLACWVIENDPMIIVGLFGFHFIALPTSTFRHRCLLIYGSQLKFSKSSFSQHLAEKHLTHVCQTLNFSKDSLLSQNATHQVF